jgi:hypothetical protein
MSASATSGNQPHPTPDRLTLLNADLGAVAAALSIEMPPPDPVRYPLGQSKS